MLLTKYSLPIALLICCGFLFLISPPSRSQGKLMLVGGGAEDHYGDSPNWSNAPYRWALEQATNKSVAIIAFQAADTTAFLKEYFQQLGAIRTSNFAINSREQANAPNIYEELMAHDLIFFKGGDQAKYYQAYRGTEVARAIREKFAQGGVIAGTSAGMAILSEIIFTAEEGTLFPDQLLENLFHDNLILKDDFLGLLPSYIADSHFVERGRFARLMGFMGNWMLTKDENIGGIGVDDQTAFCIDENMIGTAYGNGAVSIYHAKDFSSSMDKPVSDSIQAVHLLHYHQYDLKEKALISQYTQNFSPLKRGETGDYTLFLSGSSPLAHNIALLEDFLQQANSDIFIVSWSNSPIADAYSEYLFEKTNKPIQRIATTPSNQECQEASLRNKIRQATAFLFVDNHPQQLFAYLESHATGKVLKEQLQKSGNILAFIGEDSKYAGHTYVANNTTDRLNSFYGDLEFQQGLALLSNSTVLPCTYDPNTADFYENNTAAILHALAEEQLHYGFYLNKESYIKFFQQNGANQICSKGRYSSILLSNTSTAGSFATESVNSSGDRRMQIGFDRMNYSLLGSSPLSIGAPIATEDPSGVPELIPPTQFQGTINNNHQIMLSWEHDGQGIDGFQLERSKNSETYELIATFNDNIFLDTAIAFGNTYQYRVRSYQDMQTSCDASLRQALHITSLANPATARLQLQGNGSRMLQLTGSLKGKAIWIGLYSLGGRLLYQDEQYRIGTAINLHKLPAGLYLLKAALPSRSITFKLVIGN